MENKQIDEMAKDFCAVGIPCEECHLYENRCHAKKYAERAYKAGYRKADEVTAEIFEDIDNLLLFTIGIIDERLDSAVRENNYGVANLMSDNRSIVNALRLSISERKKKYTVTDTNVTTNTEET